jgi:alkylhydroperoxidase family enzyme
MDTGSAVGRQEGVTEKQLVDLPRYQTSEAFSDVERLVLDLAVHMAATPVDVPADLTTSLRRHLSATQLVELSAAIAWENYRARFNRVHGVRPVGLAEGRACVLPERPPVAAPRA